MSRDIVRVERQRLFQKLDPDRTAVGHAGSGVGQCAKIEVVGIQIVWTLSPGALNLAALQARFDNADHTIGDSVLEVEHVLRISVISVRPEMRAGLGFDELRCDAQAVAGLSHAPFKEVANAKLAPDLAHIDGLALVDEAGIARDHEQPLDVRETGRDVVDHPVREIVLLGIAAHVLEWQNGDRRLVRQ